MFDVGAIKQNFGRAARSYDDNAQLQRHVRARCLALARQQWRPGAHILDNGCGTGALFAEAKDWLITSLDVSFGMCRLAAKQQPVINGNAEALPFADAMFDGIFSSLMLQWANDAKAAFCEMARVLKPGGHAVIATLADGTLHELREAFAALDAYPHVSDFLAAHQVLAMAGDAEFSLVAAKQDVLVEHYPDTVELMRSLQAIGATNKQKNRKRGLMTPKQFTLLEQAYAQKFRDARGLPASWQVLTMVLRRN